MPATLPYTTNPKWSATDPRAFRFPVQKPYSCLYVALLDEDVVGLSEGIGRVVIPLATLASGTEYDVWLPMHLQTDMSGLHTRGHLRLRYTLTLSERSRLLEYPFDSPRSFVLPFHSTARLRDAQFAIEGVDSDGRYSWDTLHDHFDELKEHLQWANGVAGVVRKILFWKWPHSIVSAIHLVAWQFLVSFPVWIPSFLLIEVLIRLHFTYDHQPSRPPLLVQRKPPQILWSALTDTAPPPIVTGHSAPPAHPIEEWLAEKKTGTKDWHKRAGGAEEDLDSLQDALDEMRAKVDDYVAVAASNDLEAAKKAQQMLRGKSDDSLRQRELAEIDNTSLKEEAIRVDLSTSTIALDALNPMARVLHPVQVRLGKTLRYIRVARRFISWVDYRLTLWLYLFILGSALLLGTLLTYLPWAWIFVLSLRAIGVLMFGAHAVARRAYRLPHNPHRRPVLVTRSSPPRGRPAPRRR